MRVLAMEREVGDEGTAVAALVAAGHEVVRCDGVHDTEHEAELDGRLCAGMPDQSGCPLDRWPVDVAMAVRGSGGPSTESEAGVRCALRRRIPVMVVGRSEGAAYERWVAEVVDPLDARLGDRVEELGRSAMDPIVDAVRAAVEGVVERHGAPEMSFEVCPTHTDTRLRVVIRTSVELDPQVSQAAAVRAVAALDDLDLWFDRVDVDVSGPDGP